MRYNKLQKFFSIFPYKSSKSIAKPTKQKDQTKPKKLLNTKMIFCSSEALYTKAVTPLPNKHPNLSKLEDLKNSLSNMFNKMIKNNNQNPLYN